LFDEVSIARSSFLARASLDMTVPTGITATREISS